MTTPTERAVSAWSSAAQFKLDGTARPLVRVPLSPDVGDFHAGERTDAGCSADRQRLSGLLAMPAPRPGANA